jgi:hypothetical protein
MGFSFGTASAWTSDPGASIGRVLRHRIWMKASISRRSGGGARAMLRKTFTMLRKRVFNVANHCPCNIQREKFASMLRVCMWHVASSRVCNIRCFGKGAQGRTGSLPPPTHGFRGGGGVRARRPNFQSAHREEWVWRISSRESSAPHWMKPSPTALKPLLDALLEGDLQIR